MKPAGEDLILAIDVGTSGVKAGLVDASGKVSSVRRAGYPTRTVAGGGFIQEPEDWWRALLASARETLRQARTAHVAGLVLSSQIGTHLLVTSAGDPLTEAVTWQDGRSIGDQLAIEQEFTRPRIAALIGINLPSAASWPLPRLRWFEREHAAAFGQARYLFQPKEFLIHRLTGAVVGDSSSWRGLVNPSTRSASGVLDAFGVSDLTVPIKEPTDVAGELREEVADELGLEPKTPVFVGWNDLNCSLLGAGAIADGDAFDLGGTSEHVGVVIAMNRSDGFEPSAGAPLAMEAPFGSTDGLPRIARYGVSSNGGLVVEWCRSLAGSRSTANDIERLASTAPPGSNGVIFLPYIAGERAPVWNPDARGAFAGLTLRTTVHDFLRGALEGVAFNLRQIMEVVGPTAVGANVPILTAGGPARMSLWNQIKADVFGRRVAVPREPEVGIGGAAMVAATGLEWHSSLLAAARAMRPELTFMDPEPQNTEIYESAYGRYLRLYPALK